MATTAVVTTTKPAADTSSMAAVISRRPLSFLDKGVNLWYTFSVVGFRRIRAYVVAEHTLCVTVDRLPKQQFEGIR